MTPRDPERALLQIDGLSVELPTQSGPVRVLHDVSFDVRAGEVVGVVGESGSGKSMTALSVLRLLIPGGRITSGSVTFDGEDLVGLSQKRLRTVRGGRIGMVFQDPMTTLNPVITVGAQIDEAYRLHHRGVSRSAAREQTLRVLRLVGVPDADQRARLYPHQWSGGMRQRAVIAMALVNDPEVIIADEPTTALDATIQAQVLETLLRARDELGVAIILITHDLGVIAQVASRVVVMYAGGVVEIADTDELFRESRHPYSHALMASRPSVGNRGRILVTIPGRPPAMTALPPGCPFAPRCTDIRKDEQCHTVQPRLERSSDGRLSACHFRETPPTMKKTV